MKNTEVLVLLIQILCGLGVLSGLKILLFSKADHSTAEGNDKTKAKSISLMGLSLLLVCGTLAFFAKDLCNMAVHLLV